MPQRLAGWCFQRIFLGCIGGLPAKNYALFPAYLMGYLCCINASCCINDLDRCAYSIDAVPSMLCIVSPELPKLRVARHGGEWEPIKKNHLSTVRFIAVLGDRS